MKNRIVLLGDSLGMPTGFDEVEYEDTYPYLLNKRLVNFEIISRHVRANDTTRQLSEQNVFDDIEMLKPNYLVVHLGIVDCAPRVFSKIEHAIINLLPIRINKIILSVTSKYRIILTKLFQKVYVKPEKYKSNLIKLIEISEKKSIQLIFIAILKTSEENIKKSYKFKENIEQYNFILKELCNLRNISLIEYVYPNDYLLPDGIHINKNGNLFLVNEIIRKVIKC